MRVPLLLAADLVSGLVHTHTDTHIGHVDWRWQCSVPPSECHSIRGQAVASGQTPIEWDPYYRLTDRQTDCRLCSTIIIISGHSLALSHYYKLVIAVHSMPRSGLCLLFA